ncbi:MAG: hypothetical protein QXF35_03395 [Candidatus Bilamarchaeaceae archaeon]
MEKIAPLIIAFLMCVVLLSIFVNVFLYFENEKSKSTIALQEKEIKETKMTITKTIAEMQALNSSLKKTISELEETRETLEKTEVKLNETKKQLEETKGDLEKTKEELNSTRSLLNKTKIEINRITKEIEELEQTVNESVSWFKKNSHLPHSADSFIYRVEQKCIDDGRVNLGCIAYVMSAKAEIVYVQEDPDRLLSLDELLKNKGGDCEDFALFLKATLNTLKSLDKKGTIEAWKVKSDGHYTVYVEKTSRGMIEYYVDGTDVPLGKLEELQPYVICYGIDYYTGHCIIALSENTITSIEEIKKINGAQIFEPQNGMYMGEIGKELKLCEDGQKQCERMPDHISFIISDNDLYQFKNESWKSYSFYEEKIKEIRKNFQRLE